MEFEYLILPLTPYAAGFALPLLNWSRSILQFRWLLIPLTTMELIGGCSSVLKVTTFLWSEWL